jgi:hypothetical protein
MSLYDYAFSSPANFTEPYSNGDPDTAPPWRDGNGFHHSLTTLYWTKQVGESGQIQADLRIEAFASLSPLLPDVEIGTQIVKLSEPFTLFGGHPDLVVAMGLKYDYFGQTSGNYWVIEPKVDVVRQTFEGYTEVRGGAAAGFLVNLPAPPSWAPGIPDGYRGRAQAYVGIEAYGYSSCCGPNSGEEGWRAGLFFKYGGQEPQMGGR